MHQRVLQRVQLLFTQFDLIGDLTRVHDELRFHVDEIVVVGVLVVAEGLLEDLRQVRAATIDVLLQRLGFAELLQQPITFRFQNFL